MDARTAATSTKNYQWCEREWAKRAWYDLCRKNKPSPTVDLGDFTATLHSDTDVHISEAVSAKQQHRLECLLAQKARLD